METEEAARRRQFGREGVDRETARIRCEQVWFARGAASEYGALQVGISGTASTITSSPSGNVSTDVFAAHAGCGFGRRTGRHRTALRRTLEDVCHARERAFYTFLVDLDDRNVCTAGGKRVRDADAHRSTADDCRAFDHFNPPSLGRPSLRRW